ncbi:MAG TPA: hypothetical protein VK826_11795 [Bacteroidia bacterium]|nr:hypothetical protein [Bacteroidia bacterium]
MRYANTMLRCNLIFPVLLFCFIAQAQTLPPPPGWKEPTEEEFQHALMKSHATLDELIFPLNHYLPEENIYFETADSLFEKNKIRRAFFYNVPGDTARAMPDQYYTSYTRSGQVESTSVVYMEPGDSAVRNWTYTPSGKMKSYVTLNCDPVKNKPGKWSIHGDSMSFKYNSADQLIEMTRNSVVRKNGTQSKTFISKETYTYNADGQIATKKIDMYRYVYLYNMEKKLVRVNCVSAGNVVEMIDSFAWSQSGNTETMEHWAIGGGSIRLLMDKLVTEKGTGRHLSYTLFPEEKFNYIRDMYGACTIAFEYDTDGREVRRKITLLNGTLLGETVVQYDAQGRPARVEFTSPFELEMGEEETEEAYDQRMARFANCYIKTTLTYQLDKTDALVEFIEVHQMMERITGETRVMLEKAPGAGRVYVKHEFY